MMVQASTPDLPFHHPVRVYSPDLGIGELLEISGCLRFMDRGRVEAIEKLCQSSGEESWLSQFMINVYRVDAVLVEPAHLGDELEVLSGLHPRTSHRAAFEQRLVNESGAVVADATVEVLFLDDRGQLAPVPEALTMASEGSCSTLVSQDLKFTPRRRNPQFPFRRSFRIYYEDTDTQGIAYHVTYVRFCERAVTELIDDICTGGETLRTWLDVNRVRLTRLSTTYLKACKLGEMLEVQVRVQHLEANRALLELRLVKSDDPRIITTNVLMELAFSRTDGSSPSIPDALRVMGSVETNGV